MNVELLDSALPFLRAVFSNWLKAKTCLLGKFQLAGCVCSMKVEVPSDYYNIEWTLRSRSSRCALYVEIFTNAHCARFQFGFVESGSLIMVSDYPTCDELLSELETKGLYNFQVFTSPGVYPWLPR